MNVLSALLTLCTLIAIVDLVIWPSSPLLRCTRRQVVCSGDELLILGRDLDKRQTLREAGLEAFLAVDSCHSDGKIAAVGRSATST